TTAVTRHRDRFIHISLAASLSARRLVCIHFQTGFCLMRHAGMRSARLGAPYRPVWPGCLRSHYPLGVRRRSATFYPRTYTNGYARDREGRRETDQEPYHPCLDV